MNLYANIDKLQNKVLGIYPCENDNIAKRANLQTMYSVDNPIGLIDKDIVLIGDIDINTGVVKGCEHKIVCNLAQLYEELQMMRGSLNDKK